MFNKLLGRTGRAGRARITIELDQIQALILRPRPAPYFGTHALVRFDDEASARTAMARLADTVTVASDWDEPRDAWTSVALSFQGLRALGVPESSLQTFPANFREGMRARADKLRDHGPNDPKHWAPVFTDGVHAALSVYAVSEAAWGAEVRRYEERLAALPGIVVLHREDFHGTEEAKNAFGYRDGIAQPTVEGSGVQPWAGDGKAIKAGEFVLGYPGEANISQPVPQPAELGRNGSYLVFRRYHSHVAEFNQFLHRSAKTPAERELLAAKLVGRWRSGAPLALAPTADDAQLGADPNRNNNFTYADDQRGLATPLGSHTRRMNPRDTKLSVLSNPDIHRIIRRATNYGPPAGDEMMHDDGQERGLDFVGIGARAIDVVEFLQSEWVNSGNFVGNSREKDPMIGVLERDDTFTVPGSPPRRIRDLRSFNTLRGGEYFFIPSISALRWLGSLGEGAT